MKTTPKIPLILIVDNEHELWSVLADTLAESGFRVVVAVNGLQALHAVANEVPAAVLLDVHMPVLDGAGFCQRLAEYGAKTRVIAMTGDRLTRRQLNRLGATAFIRKPFDLNDMIDAIQGVEGQVAA